MQEQKSSNKIDVEFTRALQTAKEQLLGNRAKLFESLTREFHPGDDKYDDKLNKYKAFGCY